MSVITRQHTYTAGDTVDPDENNANENALYNLVNGDLDNDNIASDAAIAESKLSFNTSTGHSHDGEDSKKITINRSFTWGLLGTIATGNEQGMKYICPQAMTVTNIRAKTDSGTATIRIQKNTTSIDASASVTSTAGNITSFDSASIAAGNVITLDVTAVSSCVGLYVVMECEQ